MQRLFATLLLLIPLITSAQPTLQQIIDRAPPGARIDLPAGHWRGNLTITKPLILTGQGERTLIEGDGNGSILTITSDHVTLSHLTLHRSGQKRYQLDAAITITKSQDVTVHHCTIREALFGIFAQYSRHLTLNDNTIQSYPEPTVDNRGDGIRLWGVRDSLVARNRLIHSRDLSVNRSTNITIENNTVTHSRNGILLYMSHDINATANTLTRNLSGITTEGGTRLTLTHNAILHSHGATATGILLTGGQNIRIHHNTLSGHVQAFYIDTSIAESGMQRFIEHNRIVGNHTAFHFHAAINNNVIRHNTITDNLEDITLDILPTKTYSNQIERNYWDQYQGLDRDHNGIGDTPYLILRYRDALWQYDHHLQFFYAAPVLSFLHFMDRLAPLSEPILLTQDTQPLHDPQPHAMATQ